MKMLRRIYFKIFKHYKRLEVRLFTYSEADTMMKFSVGKPESDQWVLAKEEDTNFMYGYVYLERKIRITE